ncbi:aromatic-ring hydroxylase C-terminal domain-containing protein [Amycolatopsis speibonae]|uniref:Uncharacterized protein n=1 Tax=Amycolatopsis speibonae TaxID=1450224 RepID=A0ABV7P263_9PSEU
MDAAEHPHRPRRPQSGVPADSFAKVAGLWQGRVDRAGQGAGNEPMLIRPDGYVCWAGDPDDLEPALSRWFGMPL